MCETCGCSPHEHAFELHIPKEADHTKSSATQPHEHDHNHHCEHQNNHLAPDQSNIQSEASKPDTSKRVIQLETDILTKNNLLAERNRGYFEAKNISAYNLVSSPGSGKTSLLEMVISQMKDQRNIFVIEGDQQTSFDADRIAKAGATALQINTGNGCHLDAHMVNHAVKDLNIPNDAILFIENVGNLVCPALFDLGEQKRILIASVTEGEDKPLKYPNMFRSAHLCVLNKTDLLPYLDFNVNYFIENVRMINQEMPILQVSAKSGEGMESLINLL